MKHVASCSFGKDSLATILLALMHSEPLDEVVYCEVMFDDAISGEVPEHRDFIYGRAIPFLERNGIKVVVLRSEMTYIRSFYRILQKGQSAGKLNSWPLCGKCCIQRDCKLPPIRAYPIPTISFFAASNEIPNFNDPQEKILAALYDRLELKVVTQNIAGRENRLRMLKAKQSGSSGQIQCTITLDELLEMQREVAAIPVPDAANELADDILCELRKNGMTVSDRKYLGYYPIAQAKAWLSGHTHVESTDLLALKNYLWHLPADRVMVESTLQRMCVNPMLDKVNDVRSMAMEARDEYDAARSDTNKAGAANRALVKLRGELLRLFEMQKKLEAEARTDSERVLTAELLQDMEQISRQAHEAVGFTYIPLEQLAALQ